MTINSISGLTALDQTNVVAPSASSTSQAGTSETSAIAGFSVSMSQMGQLMNQLSSLAESDPEQFKKVTAEIAQQLTDAASQQGGPGADVLNKMAARFEKASQSGKAADLTPQANAPHKSGHHSHRHYVDASSATTETQSNSSGMPSPVQTLESIIQSALSGTTASST